MASSFTPEGVLETLIEVLFFLVSELILSQASLPAEPPSQSTPTQHSASASAYLVTRVVDGDTFKIASGEAEYTVRFIGVNTPETKDPRKDVECYGQEAADYLTSQIEGKTVLLQPDPTQTERDRYNRLLRYVTTPEGNDIGEALIRQGYAQEYTYNSPYEKQTLYREAETTAQSEQKGLWSSEICPRN